MQFISSLGWSLGSSLVRFTRYLSSFIFNIENVYIEELDFESFKSKLVVPKPIETYTEYEWDPFANTSVRVNGYGKTELYTWGDYRHVTKIKKDNSSEKRYDFNIPVVMINKHSGKPYCIWCISDDKELFKVNQNIEVISIFGCVVSVNRQILSMKIYLLIMGGIVMWMIPIIDLLLFASMIVFLGIFCKLIGLI